MAERSIISLRALSGSVKLAASLTAATGKITYLTGRVLDTSGNPISGALVEIWHADNGGNYIYSSTSSRNSAAPGSPADR